MKLRNEIEQTAIEVCKRHSHAQITELHILRALHSKFGSSGSDVSTKALDKELDKIPVTRNANIGLNARAAELLELIETKDPIQLRDQITFEYFNPSPANNESPEGAENSNDLIHQDDVELKEIYAPKSTPKPNQKRESLEEVLAELNSLIGLSKAKEQVNSFIAVHSANKIRKSQNLPTINVGLHLVFTGSPGTGKTTVARIIGRLYQALGILDNGNFVEVDRSDLVAGYVGHTAQKTLMKIAEADGGVLFIDEAYALSADTGSEHGFGDEAISTLVKAMEDKRDRFAVIVAGYREDMDLFIKSNKGLKSRFQTFIEFEDYSPIELIQIFKSIAQRSKVNCSEEVETEILRYITTVNPTGEDGNGRFARNLFEKMFQNLTTRVMTSGFTGKDDLSNFNVVDIPASGTTSEDEGKSEKLPFGFN
jgi:SpoVK/Ycf46/Vps4 family AAA+-type ATPase